VASGYTGRDYDYGYYYSRTAAETRTNWNGTGEPNPGNTSGIFLSSGTLNLNGSWDVQPTELVAILHGGDINVEVQGFLMLVASGTITFASNVTQAEGFYVANTITVASTGNTATEQRFVGEGSFVGWNTINLLRNRGTNNNIQSTEFFRFRPDLVYYAPDFIKTSKVIWQEIAP